jgi:hypothetical protein
VGLHQGRRWFSLLLFFGAGVFFASYFLAWLWPAAFPRRAPVALAPALTSLGLGAICFLQFAVLLVTRRGRDGRR